MLSHYLSCPITGARLVSGTVVRRDGLTYATNGSSSTMRNRLLEQLAQWYEAHGKLPEPSWDGYCCPITLCPMIDPVVANDGHTYERAALEKCRISPMTRQPITRILSDHTLQALLLAHVHCTALPPPKELLVIHGSVYVDIVVAMQVAAVEGDVPALHRILASLRSGHRLGLPGGYDPLMPVVGLGHPITQCRATGLLTWVGQMLLSLAAGMFDQCTFNMVSAVLPLLVDRYQFRLRSVAGSGGAKGTRLYWLRQLQDAMVTAVRPADLTSLNAKEGYDLWLRCQQAIDCLSSHQHGVARAFAVAQDLEAFFLEVLCTTGRTSRREARSIRRGVERLSGTRDGDER